MTVEEIRAQFAVMGADVSSALVRQMAEENGFGSKKAKYVTPARAKVLAEHAEEVLRVPENVEALRKEFEIPTAMIFNADETSMACREAGVAPETVLIPNSQPHAETVR